MKKLVSTIALLAMLLVASSSYNDSDSGIAVGDIVPEISVKNASSEFDTRSNEGKYVLLTFWSSADAQSRVDCNAYSAWFRNHDSSNLKHVAINFDNRSELFQEIVRLDNLDDEAQFNVNGDQASLIRSEFGLNEGFGSVLLSPEGRVEIINPSTSELSSLI